MKRWKQYIVLLIMFMAYNPMSVLAASGDSKENATDVYVGVVTTTAKSNVRFLIVDESDMPIDDASIEIWANEVLKYQLLGVSYEDGTYETVMPYGTYSYKVYKTGYQITEQELLLSMENNPHVEKVILKRQTQKKDEALQENGTTNGFVKTGDQAKVIKYALLAVIAIMLALLSWLQLKRGHKRGY